MIIRCEEGTEVKTARRSCMKQSEAAEAVGLCTAAYQRRERFQGTFQLQELERLYAELGVDGRDTLRALIVKKFC